jgi:predicted nucleic acid-binding Zn ribbon protein
VSGQHCESCGLPVGDKAYRLPGSATWFCAIACIEAELFGGPHCRWCGAAISKPYASVDSRLCSEGCAGNYHAHVLGDGTARLGSGKRLLLWLRRNEPELYRQIAGVASQAEGYCQNPRCPRGEDGQPAKLAHLRAGTHFCSDACKMQVQRSSNRLFSHSKRAILIEVSSNGLHGKALGVNRVISAHFEALVPRHSRR